MIPEAVGEHEGFVTSLILSGIIAMFFAFAILPTMLFGANQRIVCTDPSPRDGIED